MVVSLHTDQVAWRSHLAWKGHPLCHQMLTNLNLFFFLKISTNTARRKLTIVELAAQLMVRAAFHHFSHMFGFLVHRHGSDDSALWRGGQDFNLDGTSLGDLAI